MYFTTAIYNLCCYRSVNLRIHSDLTAVTKVDTGSSDSSIALEKSHLECMHIFIMHVQYVVSNSHAKQCFYPYAR